MEEPIQSETESAQVGWTQVPFAEMFSAQIKTQTRR